MTNHIGKKYFCPVCKAVFIMDAILLDEVHLAHNSGEKLTLTVCCCPSCLSMSIHEGMNTISFIMQGEDI